MMIWSIQLIASLLQPLIMSVPTYAVLVGQVSSSQRDVEVNNVSKDVINQCCVVGGRCDQSEDVRPDVVFLFLQLMELDPRAPHADD